MEIAYIALGANLGHSLENLLQAREALSLRFPSGFQASSFWLTEPVDCPPGSGDFINAVVSFETELQPLALLHWLQSMEKKAGRERPHDLENGIIKRKLNAPRCLDLDIITMGDRISQSPPLILPHPRASTRRFVLAPLAEIAPDLVLPGTTRSVHQLLEVAPSLRIKKIDSDGSDNA